MTKDKDFALLFYNRNIINLVNSIKSNVLIRLEIKIYETTTHHCVAKQTKSINKTHTV